MATTEEDRKALCTMLGKLYVTANSSAEKLRITTELIIEAIDGNVATDAASRNALNKLHLALSKAMGEAGKSMKNTDEMPASIYQDNSIAVEHQAADSVVATKDAMNVESVVDHSIADANDSLLDELLTEEEY